MTDHPLVVTVVELAGGPCDGLQVTFRVQDIRAAGELLAVNPRDVTGNPVQHDEWVRYRLLTDLDCDVKQVAWHVG
jgi:hypothetical protein